MLVMMPAWPLVPSMVALLKKWLVTVSTPQLWPLGKMTIHRNPDKPMSLTADKLGAVRFQIRAGSLSAVAPFLMTVARFTA